MSSGNSTQIIVILLVAAGLGVGAYFLLKNKKKKPSPAPASATANVTCQVRYQQPQQQQQKPREQIITQGLYQQTGPLMPNTYTFSTLGPKMGTGMGGIFSSLQPSTSSRAQFAGQFIPPELGNPRCG